MLHVTAFKSPVRSVGVRARCLTCTQSHRRYKHNEKCNVRAYVRIYVRMSAGGVWRNRPPTTTNVPMSTRSTPLPRRYFLSGIHRDWINVNFVRGRARKLPRPLWFIVVIHNDDDGGGCVVVDDERMMMIMMGHCRR